VKKLKDKLDTAKDLVRGLEDLVRVIQKFQLEQIRQEKYGGRFDFSSRDRDEARAFARDCQRSDKEVADDVDAANRLVRKIGSSLNWLETHYEMNAGHQKKVNSAKPLEKYLAISVFNFWTRQLGREARVTKALVAFAVHVYGIMDYVKKPSTVEKRLHDARKASEAARLGTSTTQAFRTEK
jgi:hypothetical protein